MSDLHHPPNWEARLLAVIGAPHTSENIRFLKAWSIAEGGTSQWNPLNATYPLPYGESWPLQGNSAGVQNYFKPTAGVAATALMMIQTATNADFNKINGKLQAGTYTAEQLATLCADQIKQWGTDPTSISNVLKTLP